MQWTVYFIYKVICSLCWPNGDTILKDRSQQTVQLLWHIYVNNECYKSLAIMLLMGGLKSSSGKITQQVYKSMSKYKMDIREMDCEHYQTV